MPRTPTLLLNPIGANTIKAKSGAILTDARRIFLFK